MGITVIFQLRLSFLVIHHVEFELSDGTAMYAFSIIIQAEHFTKQG